MPRTKKTVFPSAAVKLPPDVKPVIKKLAKGEIRTYYYRRVTKADSKPGLVRIEGEPGSIEFEASYQAAGATTESSWDGADFKGLIARFKRSPEAQRATPNSIKQRNTYLAEIELEFGGMTLADMQDDAICPEIYDWRDRMSAAPVKADRAVQILKFVLKWAKRRKLIKYNQAEDVDLLIGNREQRQRSRRTLIFSHDLQEKILADANECVRNACLLALYTAMRVGDLCKLRWDMVDENGWLTYTPSKTKASTGATVHLPIFALPPLQALLASLPRYKHGFILSGMRRRPLTPSTLRGQWEIVRNKHCTLHFHDWRGTAATRMRNAGATDLEVAAITGHASVTGSLVPSLGKYESPNHEMAAHAFEKWARAEFSETGRVVMLRPRSA